MSLSLAILSPPNAYRFILSPLEFYFFCIKFIKLCPFSYSLKSFFSLEVPFFIAFFVFSNNRAPRPLFGRLTDRNRGDSSKASTSFTIEKIELTRSRPRNFSSETPVYTRYTFSTPVYIHIPLYAIYNSNYIKTQ